MVQGKHFLITEACSGLDVVILFFLVMVAISGVGSDSLFVMTIDDSMVRLCWKRLLGLVWYSRL